MPHAIIVTTLYLWRRYLLTCYNYDKDIIWLVSIQYQNRNFHITNLFYHRVIFLFDLRFNSYCLILEDCQIEVL